MSAKIYELHYCKTGETYLYLDDGGKLFAYTNNIMWETVRGDVFSNIDELLSIIDNDSDDYIVTEFQMKGQWRNHD